MKSEFSEKNGITVVAFTFFHTFGINYSSRSLSEMLSTFSALWNPDDEDTGESSFDISSSNDLSIDFNWSPICPRKNELRKFERMWQNFLVLGIQEVSYVTSCLGLSYYRSSL
ncbi:hypothetical protein NPIL_189551 [Nephila pilipes]|uniref:Uncharacterized protein n=1 Tax=Nephila pilipes TaxID=299642 RepID=A0A8X6NDQ7_NEPPI|nr:hypothetical protein NPIL_473201 [Nephila pilipes]GFU38994.1 hypothetical protein NPIL_189551 [Nephila pilipes]